MTTTRKIFGWTTLPGGAEVMTQGGDPLHYMSHSQALRGMALRGYDAESTAVEPRRIKNGRCWYIAKTGGEEHAKA